MVGIYSLPKVESNNEPTTSGLERMETDEGSKDIKVVKNGLLVIINESEFLVKNKRPRVGGNNDITNLLSSFKKINFQSLTFVDLNKSEIFNFLNTDVRDKMRRDNSDCLIVVIMTYGDLGKLYACDEIFSEDQLFDAVHELSETVPKFIILQSSRTKEDRNYKPWNYEKWTNTTIFYSTGEDMQSYRAPEQGSYFITALTQQIKKVQSQTSLKQIFECTGRNVEVDFKMKREQEQVPQLYINGNENVFVNSRVNIERMVEENSSNMMTD